MDHREVSVLGGRASRSKMSPEQASNIARKANKVRWAKHRALKKAAKIAVLSDKKSKSVIKVKNA